MKTFEGKHYYDILKIPYHATANDVKKAYLEALDMYEENALVTYALFSDEQRTELLQAIDAAYHTLADEQKRIAYNEMLVSTGQVAAQEFPIKVESDAAARPNDSAATQSRDVTQWVAHKSNEPKIRQLIETIVAKSMVSGSDLRQLREAMEIKVTEIFELTRISKTTIEMIEQNHYSQLPAEIYLRSFLRTYAKILQIDSERIVEGYLKHMALSI